MQSLSKQLDQLLLDLAWSLWTELGVAGIKRRHQDCLILLEELIILTVALSDIDPRLRDESMDWCSQYYHFVSISRLKALMKNFTSLLNQSFSIYAATLNALSHAKWPIFIDSSPLRLTLSHKSCLRPLEAPALLNIRARSIFGVGARADLVTFFLTHTKQDYSSSDVSEIGYSKRNLAEILDEFVLSGFFDKFILRNQLRYRMVKNDSLIKALGPIPKYAPPWQSLLEILLTIRDCILSSEEKSESTKVIEIRNQLLALEKKLLRLNISLPPFQKNYQAYLNAFSEWLIDLVRRLAHGELSDKTSLLL